MEQNEIGYVIEIEEEIAMVRIGRHSDCKNCGLCPGTDNIVLEVDNSLGAKVGDKVYIEMKEDKLVRSVYIVYIQPLVLTFVGIFIGYFLSNYINQSKVLFEIIFGVIFFIISIVYIKFEDKKVAKNANSVPKIVKIIS